MKESVRILWFETLDSTNNEALRRLDGLDNLSVLAAREQTAGRGQRGNRWHAAPGENLTFSLVFKPGFPLPAAEAFGISRAAALAVREYLQSRGISAFVKWPNDIYVRNRKICGMLVENALQDGFVRASVIGIGLNVNQRTFRPDLVNPVSMALVSGENYTPETELEALCGFLAAALGALAVPEETAAQARRYRDALYRLGERHEYVRCADGTSFHARIRDVDSTGRLLLENEKGERESFAFKEISFVI